MSYTYSNFLEPILLSDTEALLYTVPASTRLVITKFNLKNLDASAVYTAVLYVVPSGGSTSTTNMAMEDQPIDAKKVYPAIDEMVNRVLDAGDKIYGLADTSSKISVTASGLLIT